MKRAFTLIEVIISIFLFSLIVVFLYKSVSSLKLNNKNLIQNSKQNKTISRTIKLLKEDLILARKLSLKKVDKNYIIIEQTLSSIHDIAKPFVSWKILKDNSLVRVEQTKSQTFLDNTTLKATKLYITSSKNKDKLLIYLKLHNKQKYIFEIPCFATLTE